MQLSKSCVSFEEECIIFFDHLISREIDIFQYGSIYLPGICLFIWVCESYIVHHLLGIGLCCAPLTCKGTCVHEEWESPPTFVIFWWFTKNMQKIDTFCWAYVHQYRATLCTTDLLRAHACH